MCAMKLLRYVIACLLILFLCSACASSKSAKLKPTVKITGPTLCKSVQEQGDIALPQEPSYAFFPYDRQVVAHLLFENIAGTYAIHWEWYDPSGELYYATEAIPLKTSPGTYVKQATAWHTLTIDGDRASTLPGQWKVHLYLNNELYASKSFRILHPDKIVPQPPATGTKRSPNDWGLIIGIENYSRLPNAKYARKDALIMKLYFQKVLGIPEENIIFLMDNQATKARIEGYLEEYLPKNVKPDSKVYLYFSGHGTPDLNSGEPYLVLWDGDPRFLVRTGYMVKKLYGALKSLKIKRSYVFLDACFSGIARGAAEMLVQERAMLIHVNDVNLTSDAVVSMSATSAQQTSIVFEDAEHGLFTFYLLRALSGEADVNNDSRVSVKEAYEYVADHVSSMARREGKDQIPQITPALKKLEGVNLSNVSW
jgi:hypothetical protein